MGSRIGHLFEIAAKYYGSPARIPDAVRLAIHEHRFFRLSPMRLQALLAGGRFRDAEPFDQVLLTCLAASPSRYTPEERLTQWTHRQTRAPAMSASWRRPQRPNPNDHMNPVCVDFLGRRRARQLLRTGGWNAEVAVAVTAAARSGLAVYYRAAGTFVEFVAELADRPSVAAEDLALLGRYRTQCAWLAAPERALLFGPLETRLIYVESFLRQFDRLGITNDPARFRATFTHLRAFLDGDDAALPCFLEAIGYDAAVARQLATAGRCRLSDLREAREHALLFFLELQHTVPPELHQPVTAALIEPGGGYTEGRTRLEYFVQLRARCAESVLQIADATLLTLTTFEQRAAHAIVVGNSLGAVDATRALEAVLNRRELLQRWCNLSDVPGVPGIVTPLAEIPVNATYTVRLELGQYEGHGGFQFAVYGADRDHPLAVLGFIVTARGVEIVRVQGTDQHKLAADAAEKFATFGGGLAPIPWLSLAVGRHLLRLAQQRGGQLYWIAEDSVRMTYPHAVGQLPSVATIADARAYWTRQPPAYDLTSAAYRDLLTLEDRLQRMVGDYDGRDEFCDKHRYYRELMLVRQELSPYRMFAAGPRSQQVYCLTAKRLGFGKRIGPTKQWRRFDGATEKFSQKLRAVATDAAALEASLVNLDRAIAVALPTLYE